MGCMKLAQVIGAAGLVLGGWVAGTATGCGTAHADTTGEPTVHTVKCGSASQAYVEQKFDGMTQAEILASVVAYQVRPSSQLAQNGGFTGVLTPFEAKDGAARVACTVAGTSSLFEGDVQFIQR